MIRQFLVSILGISWVTIVIVLVGCTTTRLPNKNELVEIEEGRKKMVILRIIWELDGKPSEPFVSESVDKRIHFKIGGINTGWKVEYIGMTNHYFLSMETRQQGWSYFILESGSHLLSAATYSAYLSRKFQPIWRFDIPDGARSVYIGTLHVECGGVTTISGVKVKRPETLCESTVLDEKESAGKIINDLIPSLGPLQYSLMQIQKDQ
jgi:hypothetical protein